MTKPPVSQVSPELDARAWELVKDAAKLVSFNTLHSAVFDEARALMAELEPPVDPLVSQIAACFSNITERELQDELNRLGLTISKEG